MRDSCFSVSRISSRDTMLFITLSTSAKGYRESSYHHHHHHHNPVSCGAFRQATLRYFASALCCSFHKWLIMVGCRVGLMSSSTFIIILEANITCLNDLCQIHMKSTVRVFFWNISSFRLDVSSQLWGLFLHRETLISAHGKVKHKGAASYSYSLIIVVHHKQM